MIVLVIAGIGIIYIVCLTLDKFPHLDMLFSHISYLFEDIGQIKIITKLVISDILMLHITLWCKPHLGWH